MRAQNGMYSFSESRTGPQSAPPAFPTNLRTPRECWPSACRQTASPVSPAVDSVVRHPMPPRQIPSSPTPPSSSFHRKDNSKAMGVPDCCGQPQNRQKISSDQTMRVEVCGTACPDCPQLSKRIKSSWFASLTLSHSVRRVRLASAKGTRLATTATTTVCAAESRDKDCSP